MAKLETNDSVEEFIWACECHNGYLRISWDEDETFGDFKMMFIEHFHSSPTWRDRIKLAWKALSGQDCHFGEVLLGDEQIKSFRNWFLNHPNLERK